VTPAACALLKQTASKGRLALAGKIHFIDIPDIGIPDIASSLHVRENGQELYEVILKNKTYYLTLKKSRRQPKRTGYRALVAGGLWGIAPLRVGQCAGNTPAVIK
jgi:hypothetical protein